MAEEHNTDSIYPAWETANEGRQPLSIVAAAADQLAAKPKKAAPSSGSKIIYDIAEKPLGIAYPKLAAALAKMGIKRTKDLVAVLSKEYNLNIDSTGVDASNYLNLKYANSPFGNATGKRVFQILETQGNMKPEEIWALVKAPVTVAESKQEITAPVVTIEVPAPAPLPTRQQAPAALKSKTVVAAPVEALLLRSESKKRPRNIADTLFAELYPEIVDQLSDVNFKKRAPLLAALVKEQRLNPSTVSSEGSRYFGLQLESYPFRNSFGAHIRTLLESRGKLTPAIEALPDRVVAEKKVAALPRRNMAAAKKEIFTPALPSSAPMPVAAPVAAIQQPALPKKETSVVAAPAETSAPKQLAPTSAAQPVPVEPIAPIKSLDGSNTAVPAPATQPAIDKSAPKSTAASPRPIAQPVSIYQSNLLREHQAVLRLFMTQLHDFPIIAQDIDKRLAGGKIDTRNLENIIVDYPLSRLYEQSRTAKREMAFSLESSKLEKVIPNNEKKRAEAIADLEMSGVITRRPNGGYYLTPSFRERFNDIVDWFKTVMSKSGISQSTTFVPASTPAISGTAAAPEITYRPPQAPTSITPEKIKPADAAVTERVSVAPQVAQPAPATSAATEKADISMPPPVQRVFVAPVITTKPSASLSPAPEFPSYLSAREFSAKTLETFSSEQKDTLQDFMRRLMSAYKIKEEIKNSGEVNAETLKTFSPAILFPIATGHQKALARKTMDALVRMNVLYANRGFYNLNPAFVEAFPLVCEWHKQQNAATNKHSPTRPTFLTPAPTEADLKFGFPNTTIEGKAAAFSDYALDARKATPDSNLILPSRHEALALAKFIGSLDAADGIVNATVTKVLGDLGSSNYHTLYRLGVSQGWESTKLTDAFKETFADQEKRHHLVNWAKEFIAYTETRSQHEYQNAEGATLRFG